MTALVISTLVFIPNYLYLYSEASKTQLHCLYNKYVLISGALDVRS